MPQEYLNYNSKKNPHWGKQPRGHFFSEIKAWREDLNTDYDITIPIFDRETDAPPITCIDHSNSKPIPGANENFSYLPIGIDVITQGLARMQGIEIITPDTPNPHPNPDEPEIPQTPDDPNPDNPLEPDEPDGPGSDTWLQQVYIPHILDLINNDYSFSSSASFYTDYDESGIETLVIFNQISNDIYASDIVISDYQHFYLMDGNGTIYNDAENFDNSGITIYNNGYIEITPEMEEDGLIIGSIAGNLELPTEIDYPVILLAIP